MLITNDNKKILDFLSSAESLVAHQKAVCVNDDGTVPVIKGMSGSVHDECFLNVLSDIPPLNDHIDIMLEQPFSIIYDLGKEPVAVDRLVFMGFGNGTYNIPEFEVYASLDDDIVRPENLVISYVCKEKVIPNTRNATDVMIEFEPVMAKKVAVRISKPCLADNCMRISYIGIFSKHEAETRSFLNKYGDNLLNSGDIALEAENAAALCDGVAYDGGYISLSDSTLTVNAANKTKEGIFRVFYKGAGKLSVGGETLDVTEVSEGNFCAEYRFGASEKIELSVSGAVDIYELGIYEGLIEITVSDEVITENFYGVGACVLPFNLMDFSLKRGYNRAYWEKERSLINLTRPAVVRLWFQPDWFIIDEETYYRHKYDFDSVQMRAVYAYLDILKEAGVEIELNFGWKVDDRISDWYAVPGVLLPYNSAPKDLDEFAYSCIACLKELIDKRGYDNIKYLTFYNEPGARDKSSWTNSDFQVCPEIKEPLAKGEIAQEKFDYWYKMIATVKKALVENDLFDKIELWGPEHGTAYVNAAVLWVKAFEKAEEKMLDVFTLHRYFYTDAEIKELVEQIRKESQLPLAVTEFATSAKGASWELNNTQMVLSWLNNGCSAAFLWILSGTALPEFNIDNDDENMWRYPPARDVGVNNIFYELSLLMRYIPAHSKALKTIAPTYRKTGMFSAAERRVIIGEEGDVRAAALRLPNGGYTVAVETRATGERKKLSVKLPFNGKIKFNKFVSDRNNDISAPALIPVKQGEVIAENGILSDETDGEYKLIVYTTEPPFPQVICDSDVYYMHPGESREIKYRLFDTSCDVSISVTEGAEFAEVNGNTVTLRANAKPGDMAAVKLALDTPQTNSYFVLLIKAAE